MSMDVHYSSKTDEWATPPEFFQYLDDEFGFTLDVCATPENAKCERYFTREQDGLAQDWSGTCWMNPPYGRTIGRWVEKAFVEHSKGAKVVALLPARTDTRWFHNWIYGKAEIRLIKGRLKFGGGKYSAPFPSMVVVWQ